MASEGSEVAHIKQRIQGEIEGMRRGFNGFAMVSQHQVIAHRHEALGSYQDQLAQTVGEDEAALYVCTEYIRIFQ